MLDHTEGKTIFERVSNGILYVLVFAVPLFFLPYTLNILDFNKQFLIYGAAGCGLLVWLLAISANKHLVLHKTIIDIPLVFLWILMLLSTIFSLDRQESFFGDGVNFNYSFLLHTAFMIFYFLCTQTLTSDKKIRLTVLALTVASCVGVLFYFIFGTRTGLTLGTALVRYNLASTLNSLFIVSLIPAFLLSLGALLVHKKNKGAHLLWMLPFALSAIVIFTSGFKNAILVTLIGLFLLLVYALKHANEVSYTWASVIFGCVLLGTLLMFVNLPASIQAPFPAEVSLGRPASAQIVERSLGSSTKSFLLGAGPGTFNQLFSLYRQENFNTLEDFWRVRFEAPLTTFHTLVSEFGVLGTLMVALIALTALFLSIKELYIVKKENPHDIHHGIALVFITLTIAMFFFNFDTTSWFLWWLFLALTILLLQPRNNIFTSKHFLSIANTSQYMLTILFATVLFVVSFLAFGTYLGKVYSAEIAFSEALQTTGGRTFEQRAESINKAIQLRPQFGPYRLTAARLALEEADRLSALPNPDQQYIANIFKQAVEQARLATTLNPTKVSTWQLLALMYLYAQQSLPEASTLAVEALEKAIALEPSNPFFYNQMGNAYAFQGKNDLAAQQYKKATDLKPDFVPGYLNLAVVEVSLNKNNEAIATLEKGAPYAGNDATYFISLGQLYNARAQGDDLTRAQSLGEAILAQNNNDIGALFIVAQSLEKQGKTAAALNTYNKILSIDSTQAQARQAVERLRN